jgi:hypothetical protein
MSLNFDHGLPLPGEDDPRTRLRAAELRAGLLRVGQICTGTVLLVPPIRDLAEATGIGAGTFYTHGGKYQDVVRHVTGLDVVAHSGLVVLAPDASLATIAEYTRREP